MSLGPKTYAEAKARYKPMRRTKPLRSRATPKAAKPMKRTRLKRHRESPEDKAWREAVLARDRQCRWIRPDTKRRCQRKGKRLHAHHIHERSQRPDLIHDVSNGAALCSEHHDQLHHTVAGRQWGRFVGLLGTETYEAAQKRK